MIRYLLNEDTIMDFLSKDQIVIVDGGQEGNYFSHLPL